MSRGIRLLWSIRSEGRGGVRLGFDSTGLGGFALGPRPRLVQA